MLFAESLGFINVTQAFQNYKEELQNKDWDTLKTEAKLEWENLLSRIQAPWIKASWLEFWPLNGLLLGSHLSFRPLRFWFTANSRLGCFMVMLVHWYTCFFLFLSLCHPMPTWRPNFGFRWRFQILSEQMSSTQISTVACFSHVCWESLMEEPLRV